MRPHDQLSDVYDHWLSGDRSSKPCLEFYLKEFGHFEGLVLELGVGSGRITNGLAAGGVRVVGLDHSLPMLRRAQGKRSLRWPFLVEGRFQNLPFRAAFRAVICPMRTIGHLLTGADRDGVFAQVFEVLQDGGWFVFDHYAFDPEWAARHDRASLLMYAGPDAEREDTAVLIWDQYDYDFAGQRLHCTVCVEYVGRRGEVRASKSTQFDFSWFTEEQLTDMATRAGFVVEQCYGDFFHGEYSARSEQMIWVLRKP